MAGMSLSTGLISGLDTGALIDQLMQVEANPQTLLTQRLSKAQSQAAAYRAINTRFDALLTASQAVTADTAWTAVKASSSSSTVSATSATGALAGSLTFKVETVAAAHSVISDKKWTVTGTQTAADVSYGAGTLDVTVGTTTKTLTLGGTGSLADAVKAINADTSLKLTAAAVKVSPTEYRLQVTAKETGLAGTFDVGAADDFDVVTPGTNAKLVVGSGTGYEVTSSTNTFAGLLDGTTITVTEPASSVTVKVVDDPAAVAAKVSSLVSSANGLLDAISSYTKADSTSASLKGDSTLRQLSTQVLDAVSRMAGSDGSAAVAGLQLTKDGHFVFDQDKFIAKLTTDPAVVKNLFTGTTTGPRPDGLPGTVTTPLGVASKLADLAKRASDSTTGTLILLAKSTDAAAGDLEDRIADWDIRLDLRRTALTRQFTAMETALGTLQNQSQWLSAQLSSLPSNSSKS